MKRRRDIKHILLVGLICLLIVVHFGLKALTNPHTSYAEDLTPENILSAINRERALRNLVLLNTNTALTTAAQAKSDDMITRHYFSHTDPEGNYIWPKIQAAGYSPYLQLGENLAIEFYTTDSLVSAWMNSPTHRANILNEGFKDQGMGLGFGNVPEGQYYSAITNTFGALLIKKQPVAKAPAKPAAKAPAPAAAKPSPKPLVQTPPQQARPISGVRGAEQTAAPAASPQKISSSSTDVVNVSSKPLKRTTAYTLNRVITLSLGLLLLMLLVSDLKLAAFPHLDKKINSIVLLLLSLLAVGFVYLM